MTFDAAMLVGTTDGTSAIWELHKFALATILAGGAGIRATVPLFIISLVHQIDPDQVPLSGATEWLGYWFICLGLGILLLVEILADTIPAVDHALHWLMTPVYPVAGALAAASPDYGGGFVSHAVMAVLGGSLAFVFHGGKTTARAGTTAASGGALTPVASTAGTVGLMFTILLAIFLTILSVFLAIGVICMAVYAICFVKEQVSRRNPTFRETGFAVVAANRFRRVLRRQPGQPSSEASGTSFPNLGQVSADAGQAMREQPFVEPASASRPEPNGV